MSEYCICDINSYTLVFDDDGGFDWRCGVCGKVRERQYNIVDELPEPSCPFTLEVGQECIDVSFPNIIDRFRWMVCLLPVVQKVVFSKN